MFDLQLEQKYYDWPILAPIHIKHVNSCVSYQCAIYIKYDRRGHESPSGYGP